MDRRAFLLLAAAGLGGCTVGGDAGQSYAELERRYAAEEHRFRFVNRRAFDPSLLPATVRSPYSDPPGAMVIAAGPKQIFLQLPGGMARRYGVAIGPEASDWQSGCVVGRLARWPDWFPTPAMRRKDPQLPARVPGGPGNPLGARAIYLYRGGVDTLLRIHGTPQPWTIGTRASSGCIRMTNEDVIELYAQVQLGRPVRMA